MPPESGGHFHMWYYALGNICKKNVNDYWIDHKNVVLGIDRVHPEVVILFRHSIYSVEGIEKLQRRVEYHQWKSEKKE